MWLQLTLLSIVLEHGDVGQFRIISLHLIWIWS